MKIENLEEQINNIDPNNLSENDLSVIEFTIQELDKGNIRVANNKDNEWLLNEWVRDCLLYTSPSPRRDRQKSRMPSSA